mmetsp:Transcript_26516/g.23493  ORF Transcript_26516/g.23493 Transcript_26516/m.23493 type:complete len:138 (-) Transcript_26516:135-548(-)
MKSVIIFALLATLTFANTCGGNCPSNDCPGCPCGESKDVVNIASACAKYTGWSSGCCECIAKHESGGNAHAANHNSNGSYDVGLWQINDINWKSCNGGKAPCDVESNLRCAEEVFKWGGNTWRLWSTANACGCAHRR